MKRNFVPLQGHVISFFLFMKKHCYRIYLVCPLPHIFSLSNHCFQFLPGITVVPTETENNTWAKLWKCKKFTLEFAESNWQDCSSSCTTVFKIDRKLKKDLTEQGLRLRPVLTTALRNSMNDLHFWGSIKLGLTSSFPRLKRRMMSSFNLNMFWERSIPPFQLFHAGLRSFLWYWYRLSFNPSFTDYKRRASTLIYFRQGKLKSENCKSQSSLPSRSSGPLFRDLGFR